MDKYEASIVSDSSFGIDDNNLYSILKGTIQKKKANLKRVLLIPPDLTRMHSGAGRMTAMYYDLLKDCCHVDIMPALGTHEPMSREECLLMFGPTIPYERFMVHDWRRDVVKIGEIPSDFVRKVSQNLLDFSIDVEVNKRLVDNTYDLIISIGQVVPHEVVGMANYTKNILVGCGGSSIINKSHILGAVYGMEKIMGRDGSPVRKVFDYAEEHLLKEVPLLYVLTVVSEKDGKPSIEGIFTGRRRRVFEDAVRLSQEKNINFLDKPLKKVVVYLDEKEFKSTWLGNKAVYRTRMAIEDGGELIVLAPGVSKFGEDKEIDRLIRKYGYVGKNHILMLYNENEDLQSNPSAAAHLIHGSSDGRFSITYAVEKLSRTEVENVSFKYMNLRDALKQFEPSKLKDGFNTLPNGELIYFISNPALGLWVDRMRFNE